MSKFISIIFISFILISLSTVTYAEYDKDLSFKLNVGYISPKSNNLSLFAAAIPVGGDIEFKAYGFATVGVGYSAFSRTFNDGTGDLINSDILSGLITLYPFYNPKRFNLYFGGRLNYFIFTSNVIRMAGTSCDVTVKSTYGIEPFVGILLPFSELLSFDIAVSYQFRKYTKVFDLIDPRGDSQSFTTIIPDNTFIIKAGVKL